MTREELIKRRDELLASAELELQENGKKLLNHYHWFCGELKRLHSKEYLNEDEVNLFIMLYRKKCEWDRDLSYLLSGIDLEA